MTRVKIVADSTCDLPIELIKQYNIGIIPITIIFGAEEVRQQYIDITNAEFYRRLVAGEMPSSGVPSPRVIKKSIDEALKEADEIIVFTVSSKLSGMYSATSLVARQFFDERVTIVDSLCATLQFGVLILEVARKASTGASREEILDYAKEIIPKTHLISAAATLKYLRRSGRISRISHLVGEVLRIKPLFHIEEGALTAPGKIMLGKTLFQAFKKLAPKIAGQQLVETMFIGFSGDPEKAEKLAEYFRTLPNAPKKILIGEVGPAIGVHVGPDTLGYAWIGNYDEKWFDDL